MEWKLIGALVKLTVTQVFRVRVQHIENLHKQTELLKGFRDNEESEQHMEWVYCTTDNILLSPLSH